MFDGRRRSLLGVLPAGGVSTRLPTFARRPLRLCCPCALLLLLLVGTRRLWDEEGAWERDEARVQRYEGMAAGFQRVSVPPRHTDARARSGAAAHALSPDPPLTLSSASNIGAR